MSTRASKIQRGVSSVELIVALPVLLLLMLGVIQFALVFHARHSLGYALQEAARRGAVEHAAPEAMQQGLAAGLSPWLYGASDWASRLAADLRAQGHLQQGLAEGWVRLAQRSPTVESFADWAEPARDRLGERLPGVDEIPNDNLDSRRLRMQPRSGVAAFVGGEPVGQRSGQTLADANLLRLELDYGVRLSVPLVGAAVLRTLMVWHGCGPAAVGYQPGTPEVCRYYKATDALGRPAGRIPVKVVATMRMMSPARRSSWLQAASAPPPSAALHRNSPATQPQASSPSSNGGGHPQQQAGRGNPGGAEAAQHADAEASAGQSWVDPGRGAMQTDEALDEPPELRDDEMVEEDELDDADAADDADSDVSPASPASGSRTSTTGADDAGSADRSLTASSGGGNERPQASSAPGASGSPFRLEHSAEEHPAMCTIDQR